jgi:hypothetical protein
MRVHHHELFSWREFVTTTLMKITLSPGLQQSFHGSMSWYFMRATVMKDIL